MSFSFNFNEILSSVIQKAEEDSIISSDERTLIEKIKIEGQLLQDKMDQTLLQEEERSVLQKLLASSSKVMLKNLISKAREDGRISLDEKRILELLFSKLGFELDNFNSRPWYNFKICLKIDHQTPMDELLDHFDKVFCLRGIDPSDIYAGLCLGTKHYVIDDVDVTLLTFAVTPHTKQKWVTKGAFAILDYTPNFDRLLYTTAYDLVVENYFSKIR